MIRGVAARTGGPLTGEKETRVKVSRAGKALVTTAAILASLTACGGGDANDDQASTAVGEKTADSPPEDSVLAAAADEGPVLIYGNGNDDQVQPLIDAFKAKYPEIDAQYLTLDGAEVFQRYLTESATGTRTADLLLENGGERWLDLIDKGEVVEYDEPNAANLPDYAIPAPGVYTLSLGGVVAVFNNALVPEDEQPTTLAEFAEFSNEYAGKIGTFEIENALGYGAVQAYVSTSGEEGWDVLATLGKNTKTESSSGSLMTKVSQGEYVAAYNVSSAVVPLAVTPNPEVFTARYFEDDAVVLPQAIGLTKAAQSPNAAKVFINFALSNEGQEVGCAAGISAYRPGVPCPDGFGFAAATEQSGGEENLIFSEWTPELAAQREEIATRWNELFGK